MNRKATVILEDVKEEILTYLDKVQRTKSAWYSATQIRDRVKHDFPTVKKALFELATEGFLHIRHEPEQETRLLYRLRREHPQLQDAVRLQVESPGDAAPTEPETEADIPYFGLHETDGTMDYEVECPRCHSRAVHSIGFKNLPNNDYPTIRWYCNSCKKQFWTTDRRDFDRVTDLRNSQYKNDDE